MNFVPKNKHILVKKMDMPSLHETFSVPMLSDEFVYGRVTETAYGVNEVEGGETVFFPKIFGTEVGKGIWLVKAEHISAAVVQR